MASYVGWTGHIQADTYARDIKNMTYAKAYQEFYDAYKGVSKGLGGFTKNDANGLIKMANALTSQFGSGVNTSNIVADLNYIIKNNLYKDSNTLLTLEDNINRVSPKSLTGSTTGNIEKNKSGQTVVTKGNNVGTNLTTGESNNTSSGSGGTTTTPSGGGGGGYSGGGYGGGYTAPNNIDSSANDARIQQLYDTIQELKEQMKPRSAEENAERYGIDYNEQHILDDYNKKTNEYYQGALDELAKTRDDYKQNSIRQYDRTVSDYLNEYQNAAPTATQRGELAANALAEYMYSNAQLNDYDYSILQTDNNLRKAWEAELADNPNQARQYYNSIGTYLSQLGATQNQADVKQYIDALDAYSQMYAARQSTNSYIASGQAAKYAGLANAAATSASAKANPSNSEQLYNYYLTITGGNKQQASQMFTRNLQNSQGWNENSGGVK